MGWLIDPSEQTVFVYRPKQETEVFDEPDALIPVPPFASELRLTKCIGKINYVMYCHCEERWRSLLEE